MNVADVTPQEVVIRLAGGRELHLTDLTLLDYRDGEKLIGRTQSNWFPTQGQLATWPHSVMEAFAAVLWLAARKHGVTKQDQIAGRWALTLENVLTDTTAADMLRYLDLVVAFFDGRRATTLSESSPAPSPQASPTPTS